MNCMNKRIDNDWRSALNETVQTGKTFVFLVNEIGKLNLNGYSRGC